MQGPNNSPVFIHSLFRAGSTYLFDKFRKSRQFHCYQEPYHEALIELNSAPERMLAPPGALSRELRHPQLRAPYFFEFYSVHQSLRGLFKKSFSYDGYFSGLTLPADQQRYLHTLIHVAPARPMLQLCRSAGRVDAIRNAFGGVHIHLWREPRGQWWSYKVSSYFDATTKAIYNARQLPPVLDIIRARAKVGEYRDKSVNREIAFHRRHPVGARQSYFAFFGLWLYAFIAQEHHAAVTICINRLAQASYRDEITDALVREQVGVFDFNDAKMDSLMLGDPEQDFYETIESEVEAIFHDCGYDEAIVAAALETASAVRASPDIADMSPKQLVSSLQKEVSQLRAVAIRQLEEHGESGGKRSWWR